MCPQCGYNPWPPRVCRSTFPLCFLKAGKPAHRSVITGQSDQRDPGAPVFPAPPQGRAHFLETPPRWPLASPSQGQRQPWEQDAGGPRARAQGADRRQIRGRRSLLLSSFSPPHFPSLHPSWRLRGAVRVLSEWTQRRTRPPARPGTLLPGLRGPGGADPSRAGGRGPGGASCTRRRWEPTQRDRVPEGARQDALLRLLPRGPGWDAAVSLLLCFCLTR